MVIKSEPFYAHRACVYIAILSVLSVVFVFMGAIIPTLILIIAIWFLFKHYYVVARTLTLDKDGCTITFHKKEKRFLWNNLAIRRVEGQKVEGGMPIQLSMPRYEEGRAFFSAEEFWLPRGEELTLFCTLVHTWDTFFVNFVSPEDASTYGVVEGIFQVNKEEFLAKMEEWGVELEFV